MCNNSINSNNSLKTSIKSNIYKFSKLIHIYIIYIYYIYNKHSNIKHINLIYEYQYFIIIIK
ncbi:hypothetical protein LY90DRAFT_249314 [Neocallimastix californiae]|jgi:hypothetical protein|uniref:Uncharacterized protein n=1 Tax=Neocallimastix californiae TaxID=1754190 RepID=A0A1Y2DH93_9FUNG|nr:hypothetical protein LY90DRAFT_249314 [Neocallimastix californiae]|eukprot:ORY58620.1 hypothetical protein LY90DRAFT_249314 [Neocallimastix californiae]